MQSLTSMICKLIRNNINGPTYTSRKLHKCYSYDFYDLLGKTKKNEILKKRIKSLEITIVIIFQRCEVSVNISK